MTAWADFRLEAFGDPYMVWHDGPDFETFREHLVADPEHVTALVVDGLGEFDSLAAQATGEAGMTQLVPQLTAALTGSGGSFRVRIAESLATLTGSQDWSSAIADVLLSATNHWSDRIDAAMALGRFAPTAALVAVLAHGVQDPEYLVRYHSGNALLRYAGNTAEISSDGDLFGLITEDTDAAAHAQAAERLAADATTHLP